MLLGVVVAVVRWWFTLTMRATDAMKMNETFSTKVHFYTLSLEEEEEEASRHHLSSSPPACPFLLYLTYCITFFFNILIGRDKWVYYRKKQRSTKHHFSFYAHTSFKV